MRVLHVLEALEGGTARHLVDVVRHAHGVDHHVAVPSERVGWATDTAAPSQMAEAGATVHLVEMRRRPVDPANAAALVALRRLIGRVDPQVVHAHSAAGGALGRVAAAGRRVARAYTPNGIPTGPAARAVERGLRPLTHRFVAVSASEGELALELGITTRERLVVIPNGIDLEAEPSGADLRSLIGVPPGTPLVGTIARLVPQKAPEVFVRSCGLVARDHPDLHFVLIGSGPQQPQLDAEVASAGLGDRFHQVRGMEGASGVLGQLDVFLLTSRFEGGPYAPLEAIRAGTPVVLSDAVGNRDVVEDGASGRVVPVGDAPGFARAVGALIEDEGLRDAFTRSARARLRERFDVRSMGEQLAELYRELSAAGWRARGR